MAQEKSHGEPVMDTPFTDEEGGNIYTCPECQKEFAERKSEEKPVCPECNVPLNTQYKKERGGVP